MQIKYTSDKKHYIESYLLPYIGNKKHLLPIIQKAMEAIPLNPEKDHLRFYDPFSGTGVVSRFAKSLGFQVISNDLELYSYISTKSYIEIDANEIDHLFASFGGLQRTLDRLNTYPCLPDDKLYIAKYYCPKQTNSPNIQTERLFYTNENAKKIDTLRYAINQLIQECPIKTRNKVKWILLTSLIYESANHANTSGVFKGFHQGFGGRAGDCLNRILKPISLKAIQLYSSRYPCKVFWTCANKLTKKFKSLLQFDIAYLDPPYNQHQYGSNYHLLNTIALNDKPEIGTITYDIKSKKFKNRAGIRPDWIKTRSDYCSKKTACNKFKELIQDLNARYILMSYSIDGIIPISEMLDILSKKGKIDIITARYIKYRGGKQSLKNENHNFEFIILVNTQVKYNPNDMEKANTILVEEFINLYLKKIVDPKKIKPLGFTKAKTIDTYHTTYNKIYNNYQIQLHIANQHHFTSIDTKITYTNATSTQTPTDCWTILPIEIKHQLKNDLQQITHVPKNRHIELIHSLIKKKLRVLDTHDFSESQLSNQTIKLRNNNHSKHHKSIYTIVEQYRKYPILLKKINNKKDYSICLKSIKIILNSIEEIESMDIFKNFIPIMNAKKHLFKVIESKLKVDIRQLKNYYSNLHYLKKKQLELQKQYENYSK